MFHHSLCPLFFVLLFCSSSCYSDTVSTADDLINLFNSATGGALKTDIELLDDLDFSETNLTLPLGAFPNGTCLAFSGVLQGNNYLIKNLRMDNLDNKGYDDAGLFCSLKEATVENLIIDSVIYIFPLSPSNLFTA